MSEPLDDLRRMNDQDRLERDRGMLKSVHGALVDAGCTMGEIGECVADLVRQITKERDHYLKAVTGTIEQVEHQRKRAEQAEAKVARLIAAGDALTKVSVRTIPSPSWHRLLDAWEEAKK